MDRGLSAAQTFSLVRPKEKDLDMRARPAHD
jgi:hypothetical protein